MMGQQETSTTVLSFKDWLLYNHDMTVATLLTKRKDTVRKYQKMFILYCLS